MDSKPVSTGYHDTPDPTRLRQIALLVTDLSRAEDLLTKILNTEVIFRDARVSRWGLANFLVPIGGDIIEVLAPTSTGTSAERLLQKRGDGGYMTIMQTLNAAARRKYIEDRKLNQVVYSHSEGDVDMVQYSPKGVPGGIMPELDSHRPAPGNPTPLASPLSPWHACGPDYDFYSAAMARTSHLQMLEATCRLATGTDPEEAARKWQTMFGVKKNGSTVVFSNMRLRFTKADRNQPDGLESITVGIQGRKVYQDVLRRADEAGVLQDGRARMLGINWHFVALDAEEGMSRL